jgi:hypothetical protein
MGEIKVKIGDEEKPYFDKDFLVERFLQLTPDQARTNFSYKEKEAKVTEKKPEEGEAEPGAEEKEPEVTL